MDYKVRRQSEEMTLETVALFTIDDQGAVTFEMLKEDPGVERALEMAKREKGVRAVVPVQFDADNSGLEQQFVPTTDPFFVGAFEYGVKAMVDPV